MTLNDPATETPSNDWSPDLQERNEYLQEELKVCRKHIEELEAEVARLTEELRIAEKNELLANREARALRTLPGAFSAQS
jgi:predicted RNase H-like nuclease (RuvC/YqgF family)